MSDASSIHSTITTTPKDYQSFDVVIEEIRKESKRLGLQFITTEFRPHYQLYYIIFLMFTIWTSFFYSLIIAFDLIIVTRSFCIFMMSIQLFIKIATSLFYADKFRNFFKQIEKLYEKYSFNLEKRQILIKSINNTLIMFKFSRFLFDGGALGFVLIPILMYWIFGKAEMVLAITLPVDETTYTGYIICFIVHGTIVLIGAKLLWVYDNTLMLCCIAYHAFGQIMKVSLQEVEKCLDAEEIDEHQIDKLMIDVFCLQQEMKE